MRSAPRLALVAALGGVVCLGAEATPKVWSLRGGSRDDQALARAALGSGGALDEAALDQGLRAVRATDRFRSVTGRLADGVGQMDLDPWPELTRVTWGGDALPRSLKGDLIPSLRPGIRLGDRRLEAWRARAQARLREAGFPEANLGLRREADDREAVVQVALGPPARIDRLQIAGDPGPYSEADLAKALALKIGHTRWTEAFGRVALQSLRRRMLKDHRLEGTADLAWEGGGVLKLTLGAGPRVSLAVEGPGVPRFGLRDLLPLAKADRYAPELMDEGDRRLLRHFLGKGYLDVQVTHRREVMAGPVAQPTAVRVAYQVVLGPRITLRGLRFEGQQVLTEAELRRVADLPSRAAGSFWLRPPDASPELTGALEDRVRARYLQLGYPEARVRRRLERGPEGATLVLSIREGERRMLREVILEVPRGEPWKPLDLGLSLARLVADHPDPKPGRDARSLTVRSDRKGSTPGAELTWLASLPGAQTERVALTFDAPLPFVKNDLAPVLTELRRQVAALGSLRPLERLALDEDEGAITVRITVPHQPLGRMERLVVFGADDTRARAVLRGADLTPGRALAPRSLAQAQARLGNLGAFQRVDLMGLGDTTFEPGARPWSPGDLFLGLEERSPWAFTGAFGYDKSQGYHVGLGVQRLNLGGMGRTLDLGLRAGDATLDNPTLRKAFPTGVFNRSVDSYTLGYTDPGLELSLPWLRLPDQAIYQAEATYVEELQAAYRVRRRRVQNTLEWHLDGHQVLRAGHRYERVEVESGIVDLNNDDILNKIARTPGRAVISSPTFQWLRDTRDNPFDPTRGTLVSAKLDLANQAFGTSANTSFVRLDVRHQWNFPLGEFGRAGVLAVGLRLGVARPTANSAKELPLSERFFAGGSFSHRAVEPDFLGPWGEAPVVDPVTHTQRVDAQGNPIFQTIPLGGQALALVNLEWRFPLWGQSLAGEFFLDSGQVYQYLQRPDPSVSLGSSSPYPPFLTGLGVGLIWKVGIPIKVEYGADVRRILGRPRSEKDRQTQLRGLLISAGFQF